MLADPIHFLYTMEHFRKEDITEEMINKLKDYIENPNFEPAKANICLQLYYNKLHFIRSFVFLSYEIFNLRNLNQYFIFTCSKFMLC